MKQTGVTRKIDELGRIVLPKELRKYLNINPGDDFQITIENEKIILEKYSRLQNEELELIHLINCFSSITNYSIYLVINNKIVNTKMDPKEKKVKEEELNVEETLNNAEEQPQDEQAENAAPMTHEEELEKELETAQETIEEQKDKYLRLSAEFDNYRKRTMKEKAELILNGGEKSLSSILPVVDDFERAIKTMETATDVQAVKEGVELIYNKFMATLAQNGVKVIETKDQPLNTDYHEAIAVIPAPSEAQKGKILDCVQTGYTLNDKVLRHAKVVVGE